jgi:hypothetical protein
MAFRLGQPRAAQKRRDPLPRRRAMTRQHLAPATRRAYNRLPKRGMVYWHDGGHKPHILAGLTLN